MAVCEGIHKSLAGTRSRLCLCSLLDDDEVLGDSACKKAVTAAYPPLPEHALINPLSQSAPRFNMIKDQPC